MKNIKLIETVKNKVYKITKIDIDDKKLLNELNNFGIKQGNYITLLGSNYGKKSYLVCVNKVNFAIDKSICEKVIVDAWDNFTW